MSPQKPKKKPKDNSTQGFIGVNNIRNGLIYTNEQIVSVLDVSCINYHLLSNDEQNLIEDGFARMMTSLAFPVQIFIQTRRLDLTDAAQELRVAASKLRGVLRDYSQDILDHLAAWSTIHTTFIRRTLMVVSCHEKEGTIELERRRGMVIDNLRRLDLNSRPLSSEELADILYIIYNKTRANTARLQHAREHGFFAPVVEKRPKNNQRGDRFVS